MLIGDLQLPLVQAILTFILIAVLVFNTVLFRQGSGDYSIKYKLMERHQFFRQNQCALLTIEYLYKGFFILPFVLLITITIIQSIKNILNLPTILINGLIIILILYPTKKQHFYLRVAGIWVLTFGSQLSTLFIYLTESEQIYYILSVIFYTGNILFFFLSLLAIEGVYWEISEAIMKYKDEVKEVNEEWVKGRESIPFIFHGGIYGLFCNASTHNASSRKSYSIYIILYFISLVFLGVYAYLVYAYTGLYLGIVGLVSNIIYDIFIKIFAKLEIEGRSLTTIFIVLVAGRVLSFVLGSTLWLLGYCILYFGVSIFIGWMIINHRLPLKDPQIKKSQSNALKSPEFVLVILTIEIIIMILSEVYGVKSTDEVQFNHVTIPIWQWAILAIIAAWVVIIYLISVRVFLRHQYKIYGLHEYYFGTEEITQEHLYKLLSYILLIALGLYSYLYLGDSVILTSCIFLPLIFLCLQTLGVAWTTNQYQILADIDDYNKKQKKNFEIRKKRQEMIQKNTKLKQMRSKAITSKKQIDGEDHDFFRSFKDLKNIKFQHTNSLIPEKQQENEDAEKTTQNLKMFIGGQETDPNSQVKQYVPHKNWRNQDEEVNGLYQIWVSLTPSDRTIIVFIILVVLLLAGYCCMGFIWAESKFSISLTVCLLSYLSLSPYYRCHKRKYDLLIGELIVVVLGFGLGVAYWSVFNSQIVGPLAFALFYLLIASVLMYYAFASGLSWLIVISLGSVIFLDAIFILITLGLQTESIYVAIFSLIFFIISLGLVVLYFKLRHTFVPKSIIIVCSVLIFIATVSLAVTGFILGVLSSFAVFTISMVLIYLSFLLSSIGVALTAYSKWQDNPIVYSSYGIPHYIFDSAKEKLRENSTYSTLFSFSSITLVIYAGVVSIFFLDKFYAVGILSYLQLTNTFVQVMTSISSYYFLGSQKQFVTDEVILEALNKLKKDYMAEQTEGEDSPYYKLEYEKAHAQANDTGGNENWKKVVKYKNLLIKNLKEEQTFLFFWIALIQFYAIASRREKMTKTLVELKQIQEELNEAGIFLQQINTNLNYKEKYKRVMNEIKSLEPLNYMIYEEILEEHRHEMNQRKEAAEKMDEDNQKLQEERDQKIYENYQNIGDSSQEINKFQELLKNLGRKTLFTDEEFPANQTSLDFLASKVESWRRPNIGQVLAKGTMSADDVKQGNIGDCYLISSFGVLGDKRIKESLGMMADGSSRWTNAKGAYMVRFYKFQKEVFIIIDDQIPVDSGDDWVFARSQDPNEYWPCILEKAYAKLYKGYHNIVAGKCHRVLSEFTGGFPFEILLKQYASNPNGLWTQITNNKKNGYLMGAGTPSNPKGDSAYSKRGIVQGHAYSILDARQVDEYRLIKLKNPHGSAGRQWIGDFSDNSDLMTKRMMEILEHTISEDGFFWMTLTDFIHEFKSLYICAVFDPNKWKKIGPIEGEWTPENSNGLPNVPGCEINPHYGIRVSRACSIFISLTQKAKSALKGQNFIYMRIQKNNGKRMQEEDICSENLLGKDGPKDTVTASCQISLQAPEYPYTFSLMVCAGKKGNTGKYTLEFYCEDETFEVIEDKDFDLDSKN